MRGLKRNTLYHINEPCSVAPYVGAWIETTFVDDETGYEVSHPTWVRGLKLWSKDGCSTSKPSHPTWVRGLKLAHDSVMADLQGRTLRGCVD